MKALRLIAIIVAALLLLTGIALAVIAARFDAAWLKQELIDAAREQKQRTLMIDGGVALSLYPRIGIKLSRASLSEPSSEREFAAVAEVRVAVSLLPLLARKVVVERIELSGARLNVVLHADGRFNFDDLLAKSGQGRGDVYFDIAGIAIADSAFSYSAQSSDRPMALRQFNLRIGRIANAADGKLDLTFRLDDPRHKAEAAIALECRYRYDRGASHYTLENLELQVTGTVGGAPLEAGLETPRLAWSQGRLSGERLAARFKQAGGHPREASLAITAIEGGAEVFEAQSLDAGWSYGGNGWHAKGHFSGPLHGNVAKRSLALPKVAGEAEIALPESRVRQLKLPFTGSLQADWESGALAGDLSARLDDGSLQANWRVAHLAPFDAAFRMEIDRLDVDRYLPLSADAGTEGRVAGKSAASSSPPPAPDQTNINGEIRIGALQAFKLKLSQVKAQMAIRGGRLEVNPLTASLYDGSLTAAMTVDPEMRIALSQTLDEIQLEPLLKDVAQWDALAGRGRIRLNVSTAGRNWTAMKQALAGAASISLRDGAIKGINLAKSLREMEAMLSGKQDAVIKANRTEKTDFSDLSANFRIAGGVAHNNDLSLKSPYLRATGAGDVDFAKRRVDYLAKATIVGTAKGQEGKELEELQGLTVPVRLSGPFDDLAYRLEFGAMAAEMAKQQVRKRLEKEVGKKGLDSVLKEIFK